MLVQVIILKRDVRTLLIIERFWLKLNHSFANGTDGLKSLFLLITPTTLISLAIRNRCGERTFNEFDTYAMSIDFHSGVKTSTFWILLN